MGAIPFEDSEAFKQARERFRTAHGPGRYAVFRGTLQVSLRELGEGGGLVAVTDRWEEAEEIASSGTQYCIVDLEEGTMSQRWRER